MTNKELIAFLNAEKEDDDKRGKDHMLAYNVAAQEYYYGRRDAFATVLNYLEGMKDPND